MKFRVSFKNARFEIEKFEIEKFVDQKIGSNFECMLYAVHMLCEKYSIDRRGIRIDRWDIETHGESWCSYRFEPNGKFAGYVRAEAI